VNAIVGVAEIKCVRAKWIARAAPKSKADEQSFRLAESRRAIRICAISAQCPTR
jgi:hypothetical protein